MKTKRITTWMSAVAIAGLLAGAGAIIAAPSSGEALERMQGPRRHGPPGRQGGEQFGRIFRQLDLTEEQREAIRESMAGERESHRDVRERLFEARKLLREAALRGEDESVLSQFAQAVGSVESEVALAEARRFAGLVAILEPEQKSKLEELYAEMESRQEEREERFRERRQQQQ